jgi:hypothetical protein
MALPGVKTVLKDRFYSISRQDTPVGPRIVVIGKRSTANGTGGVADLDVVQIVNEADAITAFGDSSHLHRAFVELVSGGADRIYMVPLPSTSLIVAGGVSTQADIKLADNTTSIFDDAFIAAEAAQPDMIVMWGRGGYPTEWDYTDALNTGSATPDSSTTNTDFGFYADDTTTVLKSMAYRVAQAVKVINENTHPCYAVMGVKPYVNALATNEVMTPGQVATHLALSNLPSSAGDSVLAEVGRFVTVIATELQSAGYPTAWGYANGACAYAAALSRMASYVSPVNKVVFNIAKLRYNASRTSLTSISDKSINSVILNFNRAPIFSDGLTLASANSDFTRLSTLKIVNEAALLVRQVCQKFIGEASTIQTRNSMETAITSALRGMQQLGALLDSDFTISYVAAENKAIIDLVLTPAFELKTIEVSISISLGAGAGTGA